MLDEPYRWIEAVENRREYIEERLREGSPVVGLAYDRGIAILTVTSAGPKIFEVYDRLALSAIGHPADIEKLRMQVIDMAHVEGFTKSGADVTLHRLVNFGLIPLIKEAFDTVFGSPFIVKLLAVELGTGRRPDQFYAINYDGELRIHPRWGIVTGSEELDNQLSEDLERHLQDTRPPLNIALTTAIRTWAQGVLLLGEEETFSDEAIEQTIRDNLDLVEAAILDRERAGSSKFRHLTEEEIRQLLDFREGEEGVPSSD